jgi:hypothetical protein
MPPQEIIRALEVPPPILPERAYLARRSLLPFSADFSPPDTDPSRQTFVWR